MYVVLAVCQTLFQELYQILTDLIFTVTRKSRYCHYRFTAEDTGHREVKEYPSALVYMNIKIV